MKVTQGNFVDHVSSLGKRGGKEERIGWWKEEGGRGRGHNKAFRG